MLSCVHVPRPVATLAAVLVLGAVPACGGDDGNGDGNPTSDYRKQANRICADSKRSIEALPPPTSAASFERYLGRVERVGEKYDRSFKALEPPADLQDQHERIIELAEESNELLDELQTALRDGRQPLEALRTNLPEIEKLAREGNALARRMDLPECVTPLALPGAQPEPS